MDETLNETLQEEANRERALALYEGTREDDLVSEEVDERILKLLGLDDVFDIDYGTYMTLLRGKMIESRMVDKKLSTEETMMIDEEYKRVKGKVGRFKLKKKKITAENLGVTGPIQVSKQQYYLTSKAIVPETSFSEDKGGLYKKLSDIGDVVEKILDSLRGQNKLIKKSEETERRRKEDERRRLREEGLEKGIKKIASLASKILAPVQGILDRILNFILYTLLGRAFVAFIDWFNDPKNKDRVETLKRFLKDWWPTLLGALILFTTPFGKFVRSFIGTVTKLTLRLARFAIPKLLSFVKKNPRAAALLAAGTAAVGAGVYMQSQREQRDKELQKSDPNYGKTPSPQKSIIDFGSMGGMQFRGGGMVPLAKAFTGGGEQSSLTPYDGDGYVDESTGVTVTGAGKDTQATVLQPGEVVFSKKSVDYWGADRLLAMNKMGGGTNTPKFVNNLQLSSGGGMIGSKSMNQSSSLRKPKRLNNVPALLNLKFNNVPSNLMSSRSTSAMTPSMSSRSTSAMTPSMSSRSMKPLISSRSSNVTTHLESGLINNNQNILNRQLLFGVLPGTVNFQNVFPSFESNSLSNISNTPVNISSQITSNQPKLVSPGPPVTGARSSFIELPPIIQQATQQVATSSGTKIPPFMSPDSTGARINAKIYGIG